MLDVATSRPNLSPLPARFVPAGKAAKQLEASSLARRQVLWSHVEAAAGAPWFLGERFSALDLYVGAMTRWRPRRAWFAANAPKLAAIAARVDALPALADFDESRFNFFVVSRAVNKQSEQFELCFARNIENFTQFPLGTLLARDGDIEYRVDEPGEAIIFPNSDVALGQRAMLLVKPVSVAGQVSD